ncbi:MAG TPA: (Fe-S)-binding protein, partial [Methanotrichaceae archaeon]|nr:(Fe-S)-binding protein [Methanotrichaceae archaeon]
MTNSKIDPRSIDRCVRCGTCRSVCPAFEELGWESRNTRGRIMVVKALQEGLMPDSEVLDSLNTCTTCGICTEKCPAGVNPPEIIQEARRDLVSRGFMTEAQARLSQKVNASGNTFGEKADRLGWLSDRKSLKDRSDFVYFVGCLDSYRYPEVALNTFDLLKRFGVTLLPDEVCCGSPLIRTGSGADEFVDKNLDQIKRIGAKTVITGCAGCYSTLKKDYPPEFEVVSVPEFLAEHISELDTKRLEISVTYHDPCHLGRYCGIYDPPRRVLEAIPGLKLLEMERIREDSYCCSAGGGVRTAYPEFAAWAAGKRLDEAKVTTGCDVVVTACPFCEENLTNAAGPLDMKVVDVNQVLWDSLK